MTRRHSKEEVKHRLHRALFRVVKEEGIEGVTVRKISKASELSDPYIYQCYKNLGEMMSDAFLKIDEEVAELVGKLLQNTEGSEKETAKLDESCKIMWRAYWDFLMEDPEKTVFYWRYYQSARYTREFLERRRNVLHQFVEYMEKAGKDFEITEIMDPEVIVSNIVDSTVSAAVKIHLGYIDRTELPARTVYQSVFALVFHLLHLDVWDASYM